MSMYSEIREKIEENDGAPGPDGVGSLNLHGGEQIKIRYQPLPDCGFRVVSIVPYMIGSSENSPASPPPIEHQRLLAWQYKPDPGRKMAPPAWRCFKIGQIDAILPNPHPRPDDDDLPELDPEGQNCVRTC